VLPAQARLRSRADFLAAGRGRRASSDSLVAALSKTEAVGPTRVGLTVSTEVGSAVTRNRVRRRLRHLLRPRLDALPHGGLLVLRARPAAARTGFAQLGVELDEVLSRVTR